MQSCKNVPTVPTSRCYFFWPVLIFGKSTRIPYICHFFLHACSPTTCHSCRRPAQSRPAEYVQTCSAQHELRELEPVRLQHLNPSRLLLRQRSDDSPAHRGPGPPLAEVQEEAAELCHVLNVPPRSLGSSPTSPACLTRDRDGGTLIQLFPAPPQPWRTAEK